jgi:hypothetical protein
MGKAESPLRSIGIVFSRLEIERNARLQLALISEQPSRPFLVWAQDPDWIGGLAA